MSGETPTFPRPLEMSIDTGKGEVVVRYTDVGQQKIESENMRIEPDVANGFVLTLLKKVRPAAPPKFLTYIGATPKPQAVKLEVSIAGRERFSSGATSRIATHYVLKVDIGGLKGVIAQLLANSRRIRTSGFSPARRRRS